MVSWHSLGLFLDEQEQSFTNLCGGKPAKPTGKVVWFSDFPTTVNTSQSLSVSQLRLFMRNGIPPAQPDSSSREQSRSRDGC